MLVEIGTVSALGGAADDIGIGPEVEQWLADCTFCLFPLTENLTFVLTCWGQRLCCGGARRAGGAYQPSWWRGKHHRLGDG
jgi:hypothetical protein